MEGTRSSRLVRAWRVSGAVLAAGLVLRTAAGVALVVGYVPEAGRGTGERWIGPMLAVHDPVAAVTVLAALAWLVLGVLVARPKPGRMVEAGAFGGMVVLGAMASASTWYQVQWDQAALWSVSTGVDLAGLWAPATSDAVRFLLIDGAEVSQGMFARTVVVMSVAPVVTLVLMCVGWRRSRSASSTPPDAPAALVADATLTD